MSAKIKRDFSFMACVFFEDQYMMNYYDITCYMHVISEDISEQTIALERMKVLFEELINDSVFIDDSNTEKMEKLSEMGFKVSPLPDDPVDQAVAVALLSKLNAITEGRFEVHTLELVSQIGDAVTFEVSIEDEYPGYINKNCWYNDPGTNTSVSKKKSAKREKIVKLSKSQTDWEKLGLSWIPKENKSTEITFNLDPDK